MSWRRKQEEQKLGQANPDELKRLQAARQSASDMMKMFDMNLADMKSGLPSVPETSVTHEEPPMSEDDDSDDDEEEDERTRAMMERRRQRQQAGHGSSHQRVGLPLGLMMDSDEEENDPEDDSEDDSEEGGEENSRGQEDDTDDNADADNSADDNGEEKPFVKRGVNSDDENESAPAKKTPPPVAPKPSSKNSSLRGKPGGNTAALDGSCDDESPPVAAKRADSPQRSQAGQDVNVAKGVTEKFPEKEPLEDKVPLMDSQTAELDVVVEQSTVDASSSTQQPKASTTVSAWNPFANLSADEVLRESGKNRRMSESEAEYVQEARKKALAASMLFEDAINKEKEEQAARLRRHQEEVQRKEQQRLEQEQKLAQQREEAFKRREEAKARRQVVFDPFDPNNNTKQRRLSSTSSAKDQRGSGRSSTSADLVDGKDGSEHDVDVVATLFNNFADVRKDRPVPFDLPPQEDEVVADDEEDDDIDEVNRLLAELSRTVRLKFAPILFAGRSKYTNDPVQRYDAVLEQAAAAAAVTQKEQNNGLPKASNKDVLGESSNRKNALTDAETGALGTSPRAVDLFDNKYDGERASTDDEVRLLQAGMARIEDHLLLLPTLVDRAMAQCASSNTSQRRAVKNRSNEIRAAYRAKLEEANARLVALGNEPHDYSHLLPSSRPTSSSSPSGKSGPGSKSSKKQRASLDEDDNFSILASMGLFSTRANTNQFEDDYADSGGDTFDASLVTSSGFTSSGSSRETDPVQFLEALLDELERMHCETTVTVSDKRTWSAVRSDEGAANGDGDDGDAARNGSFTDYLVTVATDESCFPRNKASVRRQRAEIDWLVTQLSNKEVGGNNSSEAFPYKIPKEGAKESSLGRFLTKIARDDAFQLSCHLHTFLFAENRAVEDGIYPDAFTFDDMADCDRHDLAELPVLHLCAIAKSIGASVRGCVTRFEYADRIIARREGKNEEEVVPLEIYDGAIDEQAAKDAHGDAAFSGIKSSTDTAHSGGRSDDAIVTGHHGSIEDGTVDGDFASLRTQTGKEQSAAPASRAVAPVAATGVDRNVPTPESPSTFDALASTRVLHEHVTDSTAAVHDNSALPPTAPGDSKAGSSTSEKERGSPRDGADRGGNESGVAVRAAVTVSAFLASINLHDKYAAMFAESGYDDLRVVVRMQANELEELGVTSASDVDMMLRAALDWNVSATKLGLLENWARSLHRAEENGFIELSAADAEKQQQQQQQHHHDGVASHTSADGRRKRGGGEQRRKGSLVSSSLAAGKDGVGKETTYHVEGNFMVDERGRIDLKAGDEEVDLSFNVSREWDPTPVLKVLYENAKPERRSMHEDDTEEETYGKSSVRMEGYLEKLPKNAHKSTVLKRWQRRYFRIRDGDLFYFEDEKSSQTSGFIHLRGSEVSFKGGNMLEVFDRTNHVSITLRTTSTKELEDWKFALDVEASTLRRTAPKSEQRLNELRNTLIFDIGGSSVRAGFAGTGVAWPSIYMPSCLSQEKDNPLSMSFGSDALRPAVRAKSNIRYPFRTTEYNMQDQHGFDLFEAMYGDLFQRLEVDPTERTLIMTEPHVCSARDRTQMAEILFETYGVPSLYMKHQALLSMYSYGATTGVIVDIGDRCDIIPLDSGYVIERGVTKLRMGGQHITEALTRMMSEEGHRFFSPVESYIGRLVKERVAYVSPNYPQSQDDEEAGLIEASLVDARRFAVPDGTKTFSIAGPKYRCTEGLFAPRNFGRDMDGLHELVAKAIQASAIDVRKTLSRNIYLSGGTSMLPGLAERLRSEVQYILPVSSTVKIHAAPFRHHAAYQGCSVLAGLPNFSSMCAWLEDWNEVGPEVLKRWEEDTVATYDYSDDEDAGSDDGAVGTRVVRTWSRSSASISGDEDDVGVSDDDTDGYEGYEEAHHRAAV